MWFKNLRIFRLTQALSASDQELNDLLETKQFQPCGNRLIYVNVASSKKAEDFLSLLRESLGSVKAVPLGTHNPIAAVLTDWLRNGEAPSPFALGDICELRASKDERVIRFRKHDLSADEIKQHLDTGMHVQRAFRAARSSRHHTFNTKFALRKTHTKERSGTNADIIIMWLRSR